MGVCGIVPVAVVVLVLLAGVYRHHRGATTTAAPFVHLVARRLLARARGRKIAAYWRQWHTALDKFPAFLLHLGSTFYTPPTR